MSAHEAIANEGRSHGTALFPLGVYPVILTPGPQQEFVHLHWHQEVEFVLVTKGSVKVQIGKQYYDVPSGQGVFIHSGEIHCLTAPRRGDSEFTAIVFDLRLLTCSIYDIIEHNYIAPLIEHTLFLPVRLTNEFEWSCKVLGYLAEIERLYRLRDSGCEAAIKGYLFLILATIAMENKLHDEHYDFSSTTLNTKRLKTVLTYIDSHWSDKIRLNELAELVNMSEGYFCRFFKEMTNQRPMQYVIDLRINRAAKLLKEANKSVLDVSLESGFESVSYFIKTFRCLKHCTPNQFRMMQPHNGVITTTQ